MAYEIPGFSFPLPSGSDFSAGSQFRFVDVNSYDRGEREEDDEREDDRARYQEEPP